MLLFFRALVKISSVSTAHPRPGILRVHLAREMLESQYKSFSNKACEMRISRNKDNTFSNFSQ